MVTKTPECVVNLLNELLNLDSDFVNSMFSKEFECNEKVLDHPTVQCRWKKSFEYSGGACTTLGLLNGIFGIDENDRGFISAIIDSEDNHIIKFVLTAETYDKTTP